ncbi:hypothetical protein V6N11_017588 [Hibiscus sabdariffa]|uniref:Uncharacterized protein n=1 Tax=Hibiscus sabdariffa TaxID=183260 RepID=A0ABR2TYZ3_9ROSI
MEVRVTPLKEGQVPKVSSNVAITPTGHHLATTVMEEIEHSKGRSRISDVEKRGQGDSLCKGLRLKNQVAFKVPLVRSCLIGFSLPLMAIQGGNIRDATLESDKENRVLLNQVVDGKQQHHALAHWMLRGRGWYKINTNTSRYSSSGYATFGGVVRDNNEANMIVDYLAKLGCSNVWKEYFFSTPPDGTLPLLQ